MAFEFYETQSAITRIQNEQDRVVIENRIAYLEVQLGLMIDERQFLRNQVANAITSMKFDLHPELPRA